MKKSGANVQKIKRIPYGKGDFEAVNAEGRYYVDKTMFIPEIEQTDFNFLIRPRRFGKTLLLSTLQSYYDINKADRFEEFYRDTWILDNPTDDRAKYMILYFNFSVVSKDKDLVQKNFNDYCIGEINAFIRKYTQYISKEFIHEMSNKNTAHEKLQVIVTSLKDSEHKIYIMIDEYDNFTNTLLAEYGVEEYEKVSRKEGYFKQFFTTLKGLASGSGSSLARMFITGVSPVTMDDVTSGFNIGANITTSAKFNSLLGFTELEISDMIDYYTESGAFYLDKKECLSLMKQWYDNYKFSVRGEERVFNTDMVLYFMKETVNEKYLPENLIDDNVRVDYGKLQHLITVNNKLNGNFSLLETILTKGHIVAELVTSFPQEKLADRNNFVSLLFYFGLLTIDKKFEGETRFIIPNKVIEQLMNDFIKGGYSDACKVNVNMIDLSNSIGKMAYRGDWEPCIKLMGETINQCMTLRQMIEGERVAQALILSLFHIGKPFIIDSEKEANGGFFDIALAPFLTQYPDMLYGYLIEMKYLKSDEKYDDGVKSNLIEKAKLQLDKYSSDEGLRRQWQLKPSGPITMKRLILIFKGHDLVHYSEYL